MTAYHEAGHAIVSLHVPESDPLHKVTIIPRGRALGVTMQLPEKDKYSQSMTYLKSRLSILFAGRVAEEMILGKEKVLLAKRNYSMDIKNIKDIEKEEQDFYDKYKKETWFTIYFCE